MSRPVRTALEKTFHISLHPSSGENNMDQSMPFRNLPIDALELARRYRLVMVFLVLLMRFPCSGVATTTWSDNPSGAKGCGGGGSSDHAYSSWAISPRLLAKSVVMARFWSQLIEQVPLKLTMNH